jgi:oligosaccharide repeat unit polymerase
MPSLLLAISFAFACLCAYSSNRDLFSPIKLYLLTLFICFFDIFVNPYRLEICCVYLGLLALAVALSRFEASTVRTPRMRTKAVSERRAVAFLWISTTIPVASMTYLVSYFGGPAEYLAQLPLRSFAFRGLNTFSELAVNLVSLITVLYFGISVMRKRTVRWWIWYSLHFTVAFVILSASGSRRYLLMLILMMLALVHYLRSAISMRTATVFLVFVLSITSVAGVLRLSQRDANSLARDLNNDERESVTAHFKYGLVPLEVIYDAGVLDLHYGSTFIAALTNIVPRPFWPDKPDGAGPAITKDYLGDRWLGTSNLNAGFIVESIMNFGFGIGLPFGFLGLAGAMTFLVRQYRLMRMSLRVHDRSVHTVFSLVRHFHVALAITGLVTWETAIVSVPLILNLSALSCIEWLIAARGNGASRVWVI